jgi:hypothetical protein
MTSDKSRNSALEETAIRPPDTAKVSMARPTPLGHPIFLFTVAARLPDGEARSSMCHLRDLMIGLWTTILRGQLDRGRRRSVRRWGRHCLLAAASYCGWLAAVFTLLGAGAQAAGYEPAPQIVEQHSSPASQQPADARPAGSPAADASGDSSRSEVVPRAVRHLSGRIQYVGPDTYILLDASGRPQPVPGMTYEDFLAAWKQARQVAPADRQPRVVLEDARISGTADARHAKLKYELTVRLLTDQPVDVPLGLGGAILQGQPKFAGAAPPLNRDHPAPVLEFDAQRGGLIGWFVGQPGERHILSFDVLVPLSHDGRDISLPLGCPRALTSRLTVDVKPAAAEVNTTSGALVASTPIAGGARLEVTGFAGQFRLSWKNISDETPELSTVLSAAGALQMTIDGRSVRTTAQLTVQSYGGRFDRFRVRLPPGAKLIQEGLPEGTTASDYRVSIEEESMRGVGPAAATHQVVLVQLPEKQAGPVVVHLSAEQPLGLLGSSSPLELAGFEVLGAVRQYGDIALRVADDWQVRWDAGRYVRQVDPSELDTSLQQVSPTVAFQYDRQPWSLGVLVAARGHRIHVSPKYELECLPDEARLRVQLTYQVLGARAFEFRVDLKGWEITADAVDSGGSIDRTRVQVASDGTLILPLTQAATRRAEISFLVRRATPRDANRISLPLPVPEAESVGTGELVVRSAPGLTVTPDLLSSTGLTPMPASDAPAESPASNAAEFRFHCFPTESLLVADRESRPRDVTTETLSTITLTAGEIRIDQRFDYAVRFEPIQELTLDLPANLLLDAEQADVVLMMPPMAGGDAAVPGETPLRLAVSAAEEGAPGEPARRTARVLLPQPRLGRFSLLLRAGWDTAENAAALGPLQVPLASPADGQLIAHRVLVASGSDLAVALDPAVSSPWKAANAETNGDGEPRKDDLVLPYSHAPARNNSAAFIARQPQTVLPLIVRAVDLNSPLQVVVERQWLQTWIAGMARQERAAIRFRSLHRGGSQVVVELPPETPPTEVEVLLDGQPARVTSRGAGRLTVQLAANGSLPETGSSAELRPADPASTHTLELRYRRLIHDPLVSRWRLTPPQLAGGTSLGEHYWQIVLPGDRHVVRPPQLIPASKWQWLGSFWGRRPTLSQGDLEKWAGATSGLAPSSGQSEYLYSGLGPAASIELITAPRWLIVLAASLAVLGLALVWLYVPVLRRGWIAVAGALLLACLAVAFPIPAVLLGQAAVLGVILASIALFIGRLMSQPVQWLPPAGGSTQRQTTPRVDGTASPAALAPTTVPAASSSVSALHAREQMR